MIESAPDLQARQRLQDDLDTTFFVEAGAGTGKTREMVARIVSLIAYGHISMRELVAITFTGAAAAELRDRVRQALLVAASAASTEAQDEPRRERCSLAVRQIDQAAIQTIHAFAANLLREFPLQAGLPPSFAIWDEVQRDQAFEERFRAWLYEDVPNSAEATARLGRAFTLGLTVEQLRELAGQLEDQYDLLHPGVSWLAAPPSDILPVANARGAELLELTPLVDMAHDPLRDPLARELRRIQPVAVRLREARGEEAALEAVLEYERLPPKSVGSRAGWQAPAPGEPHPVNRVKDTFKRATDDIARVLREHRTAALADLLAELTTFTLAGAAGRKARGVATFHDLLVWARDLLLHDVRVRIAAGRHHRRILIDEFQDTDPLQAELVCLLAADNTQANLTDWRELRLEPGKLFIVGDPKQSIYRFRRADIAVYEALYARANQDSERVVLSQTRRTIAPVVEWVNQFFSREMHHDPGLQAAYELLAPRPPIDGVVLADAELGVRVIGDVVDGTAGERWEAEADAIARASRQAVSEGWLVSARDGERWFTRAARYSDICLLLPGRTNLRRLERAFERHDVPYRMESGSLVLQTQEVRDLLSCLRAIDDPSDQVALVAALRTPAYGCSDVDLLAWVEAGGALSYERPAPRVDSPVRAAFESLAAFHAERMQRSAAATIEAFIRDRSLALHALGQPRAREAWRRLRYVVAQARRWAEAGDPTLRGMLDWLERLQRSIHYDTESAVPEADEDAVRLLTIHGAKGLESPIVVLSGLGAGTRPLDSVQCVPDYLGGRLAVHCGKFETPDWDVDRERAAAAAEAVRLWYVAATRAREHLVISLFRSPNTTSPAARIADMLQSSDPTSYQCLELSAGPGQAVDEAPAIDGSAAPVADYALAEERWSARRNQQLGRLAAQRIATPSGLHDDDAPQSRVSASNGSDGASGSALGLAVHAVMQRVDLRTLDDLSDLARGAEYEFGVQADTVAALVRRLARCQPVRQAVESGRFWREVPIGIREHETLIEGTVDLLWEHTDGTLHVVDYKTDHVSPSALTDYAARYALQGGAYALAVQRATGQPVSAVELVFAAVGDATIVSYDSTAVQELILHATAAARVGELSDALVSPNDMSS